MSDTHRLFHVRVINARMIRIVARIRVYQLESGIHDTVKLAGSEPNGIYDTGLCLGNLNKINLNYH